MKRSNPLVTVRVSQSKQISTHLKEPLQSKKKTSKIPQDVELLKKFSHLQLLLEKLNRLELWKVQGGLTTADLTIKNLQETSVQLEKELRKDVLQNRCLDLSIMKELYPNAFTFIFKETLSPLSDQPHYYELANLEQVYVIACRLYHDLELADHSYISYQLALLYQCINRQGVAFINYKERIERSFDQIKSATTHNQKRLDDSTIAWLQSLALDIIMQVTEKSSIMKCDKLFHIMTQLVMNNNTSLNKILYIQQNSDYNSH